MNFVKIALKLASLGGIFYLLGRYIIHQMGLDFTSAPEWLFRIVFIGFIIAAITMLKASKNAYITFTEGFSVGMWTTLFLAIFVSLGTWFFCEYTYSDYTADLEKNYREFHYNKMMQKYVYETWKKDTITPGAIDTIQRGLDLNIEKYTKHQFTVSGQVQTSFMYSFFWGIVISLTVSLLSRRTKES